MVEPEKCQGSTKPYEIEPRIEGLTESIRFPAPDAQYSNLTFKNLHLKRLLGILTLMFRKIPPNLNLKLGLLLVQTTKAITAFNQHATSD